MAQSVRQRRLTAWRMGSFILFQNQFTPDEVLDNYPVDRLMHDMALAIMAVQTQTTSVLDAFPTMAVQEKAQTETTEQTTWPQRTRMSQT